MSVRPVDMQTMLPRLTETSRQQHITEIQPVAAQHTTTEQETARLARAQQQVAQRPAAEEAAIRRDTGERGKPDKEGRQSKRRGAQAAEEKETSPPGLGHKLDIRI